MIGHVVLKSTISTLNVHWQPFNIFRHWHGNYHAFNVWNRETFSPLFLAFKHTNNVLIVKWFRKARGGRLVKNRIETLGMKLCFFFCVESLSILCSLECQTSIVDNEHSFPKLWHSVLHSILCIPFSFTKYSITFLNKKKRPNMISMVMTQIIYY